MLIRIIPILKKEFRHILRDPRTLGIALLMPILMMLIYGYAISFDVKNIKLGIIDRDRSASSRDIIHAFTNSGYFKPVASLKNREQVEELMLNRKIVVALVIPSGFSEQIKTKKNTDVQLLIDGSNANNATIIINYARMILATYSLEKNIAFLKPAISIRSRVWYNPDLRSTDFIVPGLVAIILMMICALLTSIAIARERETGTMEQLLVSPIKPFEIVIGKVIPYVILAFTNGVLIVVFSKLLYNIPIRGNILLLILLSIVYLYASLNLGLVISARAKTQQVAMMLALLITLLPSVLLSGFIFPIFSMPTVLQWLAYLVPAKYYLVIIRGILLKGIGIENLWQPTLWLFGFGTLFLLIAIKRFQTKLEG